jgi:hypothetical protein
LMKSRFLGVNGIFSMKADINADDFTLHSGWVSCCTHSPTDYTLDHFIKVTGPSNVLPIAPYLLSRSRLTLSPPKQGMHIRVQRSARCLVCERKKAFNCTFGAMTPLVLKAPYSSPPPGRLIDAR